MDDLHQDSHAQTGLETKHFALCSEHFKSSYFNSAEVCLLGHQWISRGFTLRKVQYHQYARSDPTEKRQYPKSQPPPPQKKKKNDFFSDWASLFEICFRFSEMTDPRPCPRGWVYFRVPSCSTEHAKLKQTANNELQKSIFLGIREASQEKTPPSQQTSISRDQRSNYFCQVRSRF